MWCGWWWVGWHRVGRRGGASWGGRELIPVTCRITSCLHFLLAMLYQRLFGTLCSWPVSSVFECWPFVAWAFCSLHCQSGLSAG